MSLQSSGVASKKGWPMTIASFSTVTVFKTVLKKIILENNFWKLFYDTLEQKFVLELYMFFCLFLNIL